MDAVSAGMIVSLLFSEAAKEGGKALAKGAAEAVQQLWGVVREKFKTAGVERSLQKAETEPSEKTIERFKDDLAELMKEDGSFAQQIQTLMEQVQATEEGRQLVSQISISQTMTGDENQMIGTINDNAKVINRVQGNVQM